MFDFLSLTGTDPDFLSLTGTDPVKGATKFYKVVQKP